MIEILTGKPPWDDMTNAFAVMLKIARTSEPPPLPDDLSPQAREFLIDCLQIDPKKRLTARKLLNHSFLEKQMGNKR